MHLTQSVTSASLSPGTFNMFQNRLENVLERVASESLRRRSKTSSDSVKEGSIQDRKAKLFLEKLSDSRKKGSGTHYGEIETLVNPNDYC